MFKYNSLRGGQTPLSCLATAKIFFGLVYQ